MVPSGWEVKTLSDICEINPEKPSEPLNSLVSFISMSQVSEDGQIISTETKNYNEVSKGFTSFRNLDVLVAKITPCFENGKGALAQKLVNGIGFGSTEFHVLRSKANSDHKFIYYLTRTNAFRARGIMNMQGSAGHKRVTTDFIKAYKVRTPPLSEQQKIAKILTTWDKAINTTERLIENSKQQKKALMQQLLTGKKRFPEFDDNWEKVIFGDIVKLSSKKYNPSKSDKAFPCIELEHIEQETGRIIGTANSQDLSSIKNHYRKGDVLFGKLRPYLRKYARPDFEGVCSTEIWVFKTSDKILNEYLYQFIQTNIFISEANKSAGSKMPRADWSLVSELVLKLPPLEEQQKIAAVLTNADKEIELLEQQLTDLRQEKKALMQQLLTGKKRVLV